MMPPRFRRRDLGAVAPPDARCLLDTGPELFSVPLPSSWCREDRLATPYLVSRSISCGELRHARNLYEFVATSVHVGARLDQFHANCEEVSAHVLDPPVFPPARLRRQATAHTIMT